MSAPRHQDVYRALRRQILDKELGDGDKLPSEAELCKEHKVSRTTVRAALVALTQEGFVHSLSGVGTFVREVRSRERRPYRPQDDLAGIDRHVEAVRTDQLVGPSPTIDVGLVRCSDEVAQRLGVPTDTTVASRRRVRWFRGKPSSINDSYYPRDVAEGSEILEPGDIARGVNTVLAERGHEQVRAEDEICIEMPILDEFERLQILPGTAVAVHWVTGYTADNRAVRVVRNVLPGDQHVIRFDRVKADADPEGR